MVDEYSQFKSQHLFTSSFDKAHISGKELAGIISSRCEFALHAISHLGGISDTPEQLIF